MPLFHAARRQLRSSLVGPDAEGEEVSLMPPNARVVQLGDLGGYTNNPGSRYVRNRDGCSNMPERWLGGQVCVVSGHHTVAHSALLQLSIETGTLHTTPWL